MALKHDWWLSCRRDNLHRFIGLQPVTLSARMSKYDMLQSCGNRGVLPCSTCGPCQCLSGPGAKSLTNEMSLRIAGRLFLYVLSLGAVVRCIIKRTRVFFVTSSFTSFDKRWTWVLIIESLCVKEDETVEPWSGLKYIFTLHFLEMKRMNHIHIFRARSDNVTIF